MSLTRSEAVLQLGERLVAQLGCDDDIISSWLAHDIAGLMKKAAEAPDDVREAANRECSEAILTLWRHRDVFPAPVRPFRELEPAVRALNSLDVENTEYRYYPEALREAAAAGADESAKRWIDLALGLDYTARVLIQFALRSAAGNAAAEAEPWVDLAREAGASEGVEATVVEFVRAGDARELAQDRRDREVLLDRLSRLEGFARLADHLSNELRGQIDDPDRENRGGDGSARGP